ncbi:MAG: SocA family protein [Akkermansia sp.]|nr:SocA family protein [Akkermansia sp.]
MNYFPYNSDLAKAIAAEFIRLEGGSINKMKLIKLMYLLDRTAIVEEGYAVIGGKYVSMKLGPVVSPLLNDLNECNWPGFHLSERKYDVSIEQADYGSDLISEWLRELIQRVYSEFGSMNKWELSDYTHANCPEWMDPGSSSAPIDIRQIAGELADEVDAFACELTSLSR